MAIDQLELQRQQMQEAAANAERIRKENIEVFTRLFLSLGPDAIRVAGSSYDQQLAEARGLASRRWSVLLDQEGQIQRDEAALAARPKSRPSQLCDDTVPDRTLEKWNAAWENDTKGQRESLAALKEMAKNERRELDAWRVDYRKGK